MALVPMGNVANGAEIPVIGLGTFGSDHVSWTQIASAIRDAARIASIGGRNDEKQSGEYYLKRPFSISDQFPPPSIITADL